MKCWPWAHVWTEWVLVEHILRYDSYNLTGRRVGEVWQCRCKHCKKPKRKRCFF